MTRLVFSPHALQDIERCVELLINADPGAASATAGLLIDGLRILKDHPLIGRPAELGYRELLISRGRSGYVALYKYDVKRDVAIILSIRHQRESGFPD
ncbi:MAG: type II toxin-antitoxin system RelE/ParE family toxin [Hydrogenophilales bacterium]|nr:type II toxin-antitoxin system RelE/ParE family toxin [Hydrogenophilales bacterium]